MENDLKCLLRLWLQWDKNEKTLQTIAALEQSGNLEELRDRLGSRMEFGTAGLRAPMGAGFSRINDLTIIQTTQGFARYLEQQCPDLRQKGVVIGFDARADPPSGGNSLRFAKIAAVVFLSQGIPVFLFSKITPTPFVPYTILHHKLSAGIMITASHNPKQDNGYKAYWGNGAQIIPPHDGGIARSIEQNLEPWAESWDEGLAETSPLCKDIYDEIYRDYFRDLQKLCFYREVNTKASLRFVHTSVHGVGHVFVQSAFAVFGLDLPAAVPEQCDPDPEFPTVIYPNPEEGKGVLTLSMRLADKKDARVILANDPDADRLAIAERQETGDWRVFTGNETGALLGWWSFECWRKGAGAATAAHLPDVYMLASTVSSKILSAIASQEGFKFEETLTGFKWMGNRAHELMDKGKIVLFAFEEAIGFMCGTTVLDKDGVSAAAVAAEMAVFLAAQKVTLAQQLQNIYDKYGHHVSQTSYFICRDPATITRLFNRLRSFNGTAASYPQCCGGLDILHVRDLTTGYDSSKPDGKAILPSSSSSQMITFTFSNGCVATMRTSGTEPKIKYYTELCAAPGHNDPIGLSKELTRVVDDIIKEFFEPEKNGLIWRSSV
uniref:Phosphoglucomutase 2 n=1 Tax=Eptatretus burgeri TaxID=7764 RepID=A0A8C4NAV2_EPTBU